MNALFQTVSDQNSTYLDCAKQEVKKACSKLQSEDIQYVQTSTFFRTQAKKELVKIAAKVTQVISSHTHNDLETIQALRTLIEEINAIQPPYNKLAIVMIEHLAPELEKLSARLSAPAQANNMAQQPAPMAAPAGQ